MNSSIDTSPGDLVTVDLEEGTGHSKHVSVTNTPAFAESTHSEGTTSSNTTSTSSSSLSTIVQPWMHAWYHTTVSVLGASSAATLPYAFSLLSWPGAIIVWLFATITSYYSAQILINIQEPKMKTYSEVANGIMGPKFANRWVRPIQIFVFLQVSIKAVLVSGKSFAILDALFNNDEQVLSNTIWILIAGCMFYFIVLIPSIEDMWVLSLVGSIAGLIACVLFVATSAMDLASGVVGEVDYGRPPGDKIDYTFGIFIAMSDIVLSYGGHSVLPDLQATLHEKHGDKAHASMMKALKAAYAVISPSYLLVAVMGYVTYGSTVSPFLVDSFVNPSPALLTILNVLIVLNEFFNSAIYVQAFFTLVEDIVPSFFAERDDWTARIRCYKPTQLLMRTLTIVFSTFVAMAIPFFGSLAALTGAIGFMALTFVYPYLFWAFSSAAKKASKLRRFLNWGLVVTFIVFGIGGAAGAIYQIGKESSTFHFFS